MNPAGTRSTLLVLTCAFALGGRLLAQEGEKESMPEDLVKAIEVFEEAARQRDSKVLESAVEGLAEAGSKAKTDEHKDEVRKRLRASLRHPAEHVRAAALQGYGRMAIPGSSKDILTFADPKRNRREPTSVVLAAIDALGRIQDPDTHRMLLSYIAVPSEKDDERKKATRAAAAVGRYRPEKGPKRYALLNDFMKTFDRIYGPVSSGTTISGAADRWWTALSPVMVRSFNGIAQPEKSCGSYSDCATWWRQNKNDVRAGRL